MGERLLLVPPKQICVGMKSQDPMAICFTNRTKGAPTLLVHIPHELFQLGPDVFGILWKLTIIIVSLGISAFIIFHWKTVLAIKLRTYQVNFRHSSYTMKTYLKENSELVKKLSLCEHKLNEANKFAQETKRQNKILGDEARKFKKNIKMLENINDIIERIFAELEYDRDRNNENRDLSGDMSGGFKDSNHKASTSSECNLEEGRKTLKENCEALRSIKVEKEAELKMLKMNIGVTDELFGQSKMVIDKKLRMKERERVEKEKQLSSAEKKVKLAAEEMQRCKQQTDQMRQQVQQVESTFRHQIAVHEKNAQDSWIKARILEREIVEQSREAAHLKHRLEIMSQKRLPEGYRPYEPMLQRPGMQNPAQRGR
nr:transport and Golgi organization protein 1 homolog isoform X4 [Equus asinus]